MKINKSLLLLLISCLHFNLLVTAQSPHITWSPDFIEERGEKVGNILYDDGTNVYVFAYLLSNRSKNITPGIVKMDAKMNPVLRQDYSANMPEKVDVYMLGMFYCGGKFIMLTYTKEKDVPGKTVYATTINLENLEAVNSAAEIWKVTTTKSRENMLGFTISPDTSHFVVTSFDNRLPGNNQIDKDEQVIKFKVLDSNLKKLNERSETLAYSNNNFNILDYIISNDGTMYYFAKQYFGKSGKEITKGKANYNITILKYNPDKTNKEIMVELNESLLDNLSAVIDPASKDLIMFATYTEADISIQMLSDYEFFRINAATGNIITRKKHSFQPELIAQLKIMEPGFKAKKNLNVIPKTFNIFDTKTTSDGRVYFMLECDWYSGASRFSQGLITFLHDTDGNRKWFNYIPKYQLFSDHNSFAHPAVAVHKDKIVIFYNDHDNIHKVDPIEKQINPKLFNNRDVNTLMIAEVDNSGKMSRRVFMTSEKMGTPVVTIRSMAGYQNRFLLYGSKLKKNSYKIGVFNIN